MKIPPFFFLPPPSPEDAPLVAKPIRYPYHDDSDCPVGQEVQRSGYWQHYEPRQIADTLLHLHRTEPPTLSLNSWQVFRLV